ncbi:aminotransferase, partial [Roseomonas sp. DSM 102946]|nr:aminotransferase [Roseomonas sp. DSM 102946]
MELVESWGVAAVEARLRGLTDRLAERLEAMGLACPPRHRRSPHILGLRLPSGLPAHLVPALAERGAFASDRLGVLRISAHVWVEEADIDRFAAILGEVLGR